MSNDSPSVHEALEVCEDGLLRDAAGDGDLGDVGAFAHQFQGAAVGLAGTRRRRTVDLVAGHRVLAPFQRTAVVGSEPYSYKSRPDGRGLALQVGCDLWDRTPRLK